MSKNNFFETCWELISALRSFEWRDREWHVTNTDGVHNIVSVHMDTGHEVIYSVGDTNPIYELFAELSDLYVSNIENKLCQDIGRYCDVKGLLKGYRKDEHGFISRMFNTYKGGTIYVRYTSSSDPVYVTLHTDDYTLGYLMWSDGSVSIYKMNYDNVPNEALFKYLSECI